MQKATHYSYRSGCLLSVLAPLLGIGLYPRARWLFAFAALGVALIVFAVLKQEDLTPHEVADLAEKILNGTSTGWDVDNYEHLNPRAPQVRELWAQTMELCGLPEEWTKLDDESKEKIRDIIGALRRLGKQVN
jgi:hypothetical protein